MCKILFQTPYGDDSANIFEQLAKETYLANVEKKPALAFLHGNTPVHVIWQKVKQKKSEALIFEEGYCPKLTATVVKAIIKNCNKLPKFFHMTKGIEIPGVEYVSDHSEIKLNLQLN